MQNKVSTPPIYFWIISGFALFWSITGAVNFFYAFFIPNELVDNLNTSTLPFYTKNLSCTTGIFGVGIGVFMGIIASIFLLNRRKLAFKFGIVSLIGISIQMIYIYTSSNSIFIYGLYNAFLPLIEFIITALLLLFVKFSIIKGWLS